MLEVAPPLHAWTRSTIAGKVGGRQPRTSSTTWIGPVFGNVCTHMAQLKLSFGLARSA
eukprot:SAG31_NODE_32646_length_353_cov_0.807087_1_plen_57_part_10